jgi:hypothetical protein
MNSAEVLGLLCLALISTAACKQDEVDWCIEDEDAASVPAAGVLNVDYRGRFGTGPVSVEPFVKTDPSGVMIAAGCGTDRDGNLWRLRGGWIVPDDEPLPAELATTDTEGFSGELIICQHGQCLEGQQYRVMDGLFVSGLAIVRAYDAQTGRFASETRVTNGLQEEITLDVDLQWVPPTP